MNISLITLTNKGYVNYTLNCLKSLRKLGIHNIQCFAVGNKGDCPLLERKYNVKYIGDEKLSSFQIYKNENWAGVTFFKFEIISECLKTNDAVLYLDGDIVFKDKRFLPYCLNHLGEHDILIQNDTQDDASFANLCTGFFLLKSNELTRKYFNPDFVRKSFADENWDDQHYVNSIKQNLNIKLLPLDLFPNGSYYMKRHNKINPYLIHFNWLIGHDKAIKMLEYKQCYGYRLYWQALMEKRKKTKSERVKA